MARAKQKKRAKKIDSSKTIRVSREVANEVSASGVTTGVPVATFFTIAAKEKLEKEKIEKS